MLSCPKRKNNRRFPVAAYMALQKEKQEKTLREMQKIRDEDVKINEKQRELRAKREKLRRLDKKVEELITSIEERNVIRTELTAGSEEPVRKKRRFLSEKSITARQKNPTSLDKNSLSKATGRKRRLELFEAACQIHGGSTEWTVPGQVGLCETTVQKCPENVLVEVFSHSDKIEKRVIPKIYKNALDDFEKSDSNYIRSVAVYYSGGIMGKKKYRAAYRDMSYQKYSDNNKSARIVINNCSIPRLVPYNKLMPFIKSINIGKLYSVRETLCEGLNEEEKVCGVYRSIREILPCLARYYMLNEGKYELLWFNDQPFTFYISIGGDGAPFGKEDTACSWLVSFLNIGRGVLSSNENFLLFGANCKEDCIPMRRFIKQLIKDIDELENTTYHVDCKGNSFDVKFKVSELPNDMKMLAFLGGELSNAATYFSTFANVSTHTMSDLDGSFGLSGKEKWEPWKYEDRVSVAKRVEKFKTSLAKQKLAASTLRSKVTAFIAKNNSRQEFKPVIGRLIDQAHVDPLHVKNNACAHTHRLLLHKVIAMSRLGDASKSFSLVPSNSPLRRYIVTLRNCRLTRLANKITRWFDETNGSGKDFDYRFTGKDSRLFLLNFMSLISVVESTTKPGREKTFLHILAYICLCLRNAVSLFTRLNITDSDISELGEHCSNYFRASALFFSVNPTVWTIGYIVPAHTQHMKGKYGLGLGLNSMEGREAKHVFIAKYSKNTNYQNRWQQIFQHEFVSLVWLRERGYNCSNGKVSTLKSYIPNSVSSDNIAYCHCGLKKECVTDSKCRFCGSKLRKGIELSVCKGKVLLDKIDLS